MPLTDAQKQLFDNARRVLEIETDNEQAVFKLARTALTVADTDNQDKITEKYHNLVHQIQASEAESVARGKKITGLSQHYNLVTIDLNNRLLERGRAQAQRATQTPTPHQPTTPAAAAQPSTAPVPAASAASAPDIQMRTAEGGSCIFLQPTAKGTRKAITDEFTNFSETHQPESQRSQFKCEKKGGVMTLTFPDEKSMNNFIEERLLAKGFMTLPGIAAPKNAEERASMMGRIKNLQQGRGTDEDKAAQVAARDSINSTRALSPLTDSSLPRQGVDAALTRTARENLATLRQAGSATQTPNSTLPDATLPDESQTTPIPRQ